jgi:hypothetical protein
MKGKRRGKRSSERAPGKAAIDRQLLKVAATGSRPVAIRPPWQQPSRGDCLSRPSPGSRRSTHLPWARTGCRRKHRARRSASAACRGSSSPSGSRAGPVRTCRGRRAPARSAKDSAEHREPLMDAREDGRGQYREQRADQGAPGQKVRHEPVDVHRRLPQRVAPRGTARQRGGPLPLDDSSCRPAARSPGSATPSCTPAAAARSARSPAAAGSPHRRCARRRPGGDAAAFSLPGSPPRESGSARSR